MDLNDADWPRVDSLLEEYAGPLAALKARLERRESEDDLWLLRYAMAYPKTAEAVAAVEFGRRYRRDNAAWLAACESLGDEIADETALKRLLETKQPHFAKVDPYLVGGVHGEDDARAPIVFARAGLTNPAVLDEVSEEELVEFFVFGEVALFTRLDYLTRKTGRLVQSLYVVDLLKVSPWPNRRWNAALATTSHISAQLCPQMVRRQCLINVPWLFASMWSLLKLILSKKTVESLALCRGFKQGGDCGDCPYLRRFVSDPSSLPSFAGGRCEKHHGFCVGGMHSDYTGMKNA